MANATVTGRYVPSGALNIDLGPKATALLLESGISAAVVIGAGGGTSEKDVGRVHLKVTASHAGGPASAQTALTNAITAVGELMQMPGAEDYAKTADVPTMAITVDSTPSVSESGGAVTRTATVTPATGAGPVVFTAVNQWPTFASFVDNANNTATITLNASAGDMGQAPYGTPYTIVIKATDLIGQVVTGTLTVTVTA